MAKGKEASRLQAFLREPALAAAAQLIAAPATETVSATTLATFLRTIGPLTSDAERRGQFIDFWQLAELGRDELRNCRALAWFLDARSAHGAGNTFLLSWFAMLHREHQHAFLDPVHWGSGYTIDLEVCPFRDGSNRLDILIQSPTALVGIEVKIDAGDISDQRIRYPRTLAERAGASLRDRSGLIFLAPYAASQDRENCIASSWRQVATSMVKAIDGKLGEWPSMLAFQFARHARSF